MNKPTGYCTPVHAYAPLAAHYKDRVQRIAALAVQAMSVGDLERAAALYEQGVFAQQSYNHYSRIQSCIGDFDCETRLLPKPEEKPS